MEKYGKETEESLGLSISGHESLNVESQSPKPDVI
jgi:hypothetical protein